MQISGELYQHYAKLCKTKLLFAYKTPVSPKKPVKIDVSTYESVQYVGVSGSVLAGFRVFLCGLMKVQMAFERFFLIIDIPFYCFGPSSALFGAL